MNDVSFSRAASAYGNALRTAENLLDKTSAPATTEASASAKGSSFFDMLGQALKTSANTGYQSEAIATRALSGKADLTDVVTAVSEAETSLNTVVAIRDRVINAYQEIIKMPV